MTSMILATSPVRHHQSFGGGTPKVPLKIPSKVENGAKYYNLIIKDTIVRSPRVLV